MHKKTLAILLFWITSLTFSQSSEQKTRTWTNSTGKSIEAVLIEKTDTTIKVNRNGKDFVIPINSLSTEDQEFLKTQTLEPATDNNEKGYQHLIITSSRLAAISSSPNLEELRERRTKNGLKSNIVTTTEIKKAIEEGGSLEEKILAYIKQEKAESGVKFVMLVGNHKIIPAIAELPEFLQDNGRDSNLAGFKTVPSDMYYSCFGLAEGNASFDVHIGRVPTDSTKELQNYLTKLFYYEDAEESETFSTAFTFTAKQDGIGEAYAVSMSNKMTSLGLQGNHITSAHEDIKILHKKFKEEKFGLTFAGGHGTAADLCSFHPKDISSHKPDQPHIFILSTLACSSGDFGQNENMALVLLCSNPDFGSPAAFMNSRPAYAGPYAQNRIQNFELQARLAENIETVGEISSLTREKMANVPTKKEEDRRMAWLTTLQHNLFGDPALVWRIK